MRLARLCATTPGCTPGQAADWIADAERSEATLQRLERSRLAAAPHYWRALWVHTFWPLFTIPLFVLLAILVIARAATATRHNAPP